MLCENCIKIIMDSLSTEAKKVYNAIGKNPNINRTKIMEETNLSYAIASRAINELENKLIVDYRVRGRSKEYYITESGKVMSRLNKEG